MERDPKKRFSARVENYIKYRPKYPQELLEFFRNELQIVPGSVIADIGSGTGISSEMFLKAGYQVFGVEPNDEMRVAAERILEAYPNFVSVKGSAEATGLGALSMDVIIAGQSFHWFDRAACKAEFLRILRPNGWVILMWNDRKQETSFSNAYETLLKSHAIDYESIDHRLIKENNFDEFYGGRHWQLRIFELQQVFDRDGLKGRVLSCSYMPMPGHSNYEPMIKALDELFDRYQQNDVIKMDYQTLVYYGHIHAG